MIGVVVVSHSRALAEAAVALASEMVPADRRPKVAVAAGLDATTFGTDAAAISEAIEQVDSPDGVLVFLDLGSAILSAEMACEFLDPDLVERVRLTSAPLVEGLVAGLVCAGTGASLDAVEREARSGLVAKQAHLDQATDEAEPGAHDPRVDDGAPSVVHELANPHGLHARPAAAVVAAFGGLDATVQARNLSRALGPVPATSPVQLATLDLRQGDAVEISASGPDAQRALDAFAALAADNFGDDPGTDAGSDDQPVVLTEPVTAPAHRIGSPDLTEYQPGTPDAECDRFDEARAAVHYFLGTIAGTTAPAAQGLVTEIAAAQQALLGDPSLAKAIRSAISNGDSAPDAARAAFGVHEAAFEKLPDPYLRERAQDIRSLCRLTLLALAGQPLAAALPTHPHVLVGRELDATTAAAMLPETTLAVAVSDSGASGHGALIARAVGVPFFAEVTAAGDIAEGETVTVTPGGVLTRG